MKRFIAKCFCRQVAMLLVFAASLPANGQHKPTLVQYCSLFEPTYNAKTVSSSALMFYSTVSRVDGGDTFLYSGDCNGSDYFAIPEGNSKVWSKWQNFFDKLPPEKNLTLEIKFEGKAEVSTAYLFGSLDGWARAQIKFSKILSVKNVTSSIAVRPDNKAPKPHIERIEGMRNKLSNFLKSLYAPSSSSNYVQDSLSDEFLFVDSSGRTFKKDQYFALHTAWTDSNTGLKESQTSSRLRNKTKNKMIWRGTLKLVFTTGPVKTYYCDVTFVLRNGDWVLSQAAMISVKS